MTGSFDITTVIQIDNNFLSYVVNKKWNFDTFSTKINGTILTKHISIKKNIAVRSILVPNAILFGQ